MNKTTLPLMLRDECLIRLEKPERHTASKLLIIPDSARRENFELYQGTVLAAGPGRRRKDGRVNANEIQPGDRVLFYWGAMSSDVANVQWHEDGQELRVISEWQIQMRWPGEMSLVEAMR